MLLEKKKVQAHSTPMTFSQIDESHSLILSDLAELGTSVQNSLNNLIILLGMININGGNMETKFNNTLNTRLEKLTKIYERITNLTKDFFDIINKTSHEIAVVQEQDKKREEDRKRGRMEREGKLKEAQQRESNFSEFSLKISENFTKLMEVAQKHAENMNEYARMQKGLTLSNPIYSKAETLTVVVKIKNWLVGQFRKFVPFDVDVPPQSQGPESQELKQSNDILTLLLGSGSAEDIAKLPSQASLNFSRTSSRASRASSLAPESQHDQPQTPSIENVLNDHPELEQLGQHVEMVKGLLYQGYHEGDLNLIVNYKTNKTALDQSLFSILDEREFKDMWFASGGSAFANFNLELDGRKLKNLKKSKKSKQNIKNKEKNWENYITNFKNK